MKRVAILGAGGMGTALALLFGRVVGDVRLWSRDLEHAAEFDAHANQRASSARNRAARGDRGHILGDRRRQTEADLIVAAVPTSYLRATLEALAPELPAGTPVLSVVKGIEYGSFARPSQIIEQTLGSRPIAVLSGPSHAEELARGCRLRWSFPGSRNR